MVSSVRGLSRPAGFESVVITVAGGTGRLGTLIVRRLVARGLEVRVLTRDRSRAAHLADLPVEVVQCDVRDARTLPGALDGADTVVSAIQGFTGRGVSPRSIDRDGNRALIAAAQSGRPRVILVSVMGASAESPMELFRYKWDAEEAFRTSGLPWTIVRSAAFVETWAEILSAGVVFGKGDNPISFVSVRDTAAAVERVVVDTTTAGRTFEVTAEDLTFNQLVTLTVAARGRPARVHHIPLSALKAMAPVHRQSRAAVVLDTADMTFVPSEETRLLERSTPLREALAEV